MALGMKRSKLRNIAMKNGVNLKDFKAKRARKFGVKLKDYTTKPKAKKPKAKKPMAKKKYTSLDNGSGLWPNLTPTCTSQYSQEPKAPRATVSSAISSSNGWATMSFSDTPEASMILSQHKG